MKFIRFLSVLLIICIIWCIPVSSNGEQPFEIYFLDVGEGDAAVIISGGHAMMIDGGPASESSYIYSFLKTHGITHLDYIVCSHTDADHCGGLAGALNYATVGSVFCTETSGDTKTFQDFQKYVTRRQSAITVPEPGDSYMLGDAVFTFIYPQPNLKFSNNTSLVVRIQYGNTSFLFMGDCEFEDECCIMESGYEIKSDVIKIAHHGSDSSSQTDFLYEVSPKYAVISVGENTYGHPSDSVLMAIGFVYATVYRTDLQGEIHCTSDGSNIFFETEKNTLIATPGTGESSSSRSLFSEEETSTGMDYVGNKNSKKFHYPDCSSVSDMKESNKFYYSGTREEMLDMGYVPCKRCNP